MANNKEQPVREKILKAACRLLSSGGIKKLAQPQIAKKAGVPQGHMTYYFPTRSDLLMAVAEKSLLSIATIVMKHAASKKMISDQDSISLVQPFLLDTERTRMLVGLLVESDENQLLRKKLIEQSELSLSLVGLGLQLDLERPEVLMVHSSLMGLSLHYYLNPTPETKNKIEQVLNHLRKIATVPI